MAAITIKKAFLLLAAFATIMLLITSFNPSLKNNTHVVEPQQKRNLKESLRRAQDTAKKRAKTKQQEADKAVAEANKQLYLNRTWDWDYHKLYPVNCKAIFEGDEEALKESGRLLRLDGRKQNMLPVPSDERVSNYNYFYLRP